MIFATKTELCVISGSIVFRLVTFLRMVIFCSLFRTCSGLACAYQCPRYPSAHEQYGTVLQEGLSRGRREPLPPSALEDYALRREYRQLLPCRWSDERGLPF